MKSYFQKFQRPSQQERLSAEGQPPPCNIWRRESQMNKFDESIWWGRNDPSEQIWTGTYGGGVGIHGIMGSGHIETSLWTARQTKATSRKPLMHAVIIFARPSEKYHTELEA